MQASVYGAKRVLPKLSRALHVEPGILGECRLSTGDGCAAFPDDILLAVSFFWFFIQVNEKAKVY